MGAVPGAGAQAGSLLLNVPTQLQLPQRASFVGAAKSNDLAGLVFLFNNNAALWNTEYSPQANIPPAIIPGFNLGTTLPFNSPFLPSSPITTQPAAAFGPPVPTLPGFDPTQGGAAQGALVGTGGGLAPQAGGVAGVNGITGLNGVAGVPTVGAGTGGVNLGATGAIGGLGAQGALGGLGGLGAGAATVPAGIGTAATQFQGGGPFSIPGLTL